MKLEHVPKECTAHVSTSSYRLNIVEIHSRPAPDGRARPSNNKNRRRYRERKRMKRAYSVPRVAVLLAFLGLSLAALAVSDSAHAQVIQTVAGTTDIAGRPALSISLRPWNIATAPDGTLIVADSEHAQI